MSRPSGEKKRKAPGWRNTRSSGDQKNLKPIFRFGLEIGLVLKVAKLVLHERPRKGRVLAEGLRRGQRIVVVERQRQDAEILTRGDDLASRRSSASVRLMVEQLPSQVKYETPGRAACEHSQATLAGVVDEDCLRVDLAPAPPSRRSS
jgi:hypothetical protein